VVSGYLTNENFPSGKKGSASVRCNHDWIMDVTTKEPYWIKSPNPKYKVIAYDYGVKGQLLRELQLRGCDVW